MRSSALRTSEGALFRRTTCDELGPRGHTMGRRAEGHVSQETRNFHIVAGPHAMWFRLRNFIASCPFHIPITAGDPRTESSFPSSRVRTNPCSRVNRLPQGRCSDWTRRKNAQPTHTACMHVSGRLCVLNITATQARNAAGFGVFIRSPWAA